MALLLESPHAEQVDGLRRAVGDRALERIPAHVTLVPPVNVRAEAFPSALAVLRAAAAGGGRPLRLTLGPPGTFLPANPVLYLPVGGDLADLGHLHDAVFRTPLARDLAWPWVPHVTLADDADPARIEASLTALAGYQVVVDIERVTMLEERRVAGHRRWVPLADAALGRPHVVGRGGLEVTLVEGRLADPRGEWWAPEGALVVNAYDGPELVGTGAAWRADDGGRIRVEVAAERRGRGIGRALLARVEDAVSRAGWSCPVLRSTGPEGFFAACSAWSVGAG